MKLNRKGGRHIRPSFLIPAKRPTDPSQFFRIMKVENLRAGQFVYYHEELFGTSMILIAEVFCHKVRYLTLGEDSILSGEIKEDSAWQFGLLPNYFGQWSKNWLQESSKTDMPKADLDFVLSNANVGVKSFIQIKKEGS